LYRPRHRPRSPIGCRPEHQSCSIYESWIVQCRINGRTRRHKIGNAKLITAEQARETAATFIAKVQQAKTQRRLCHDMADALLASP
jgi:hypothetical protein